MAGESCTKPLLRFNRRSDISRFTTSEATVVFGREWARQTISLAKDNRHIAFALKNESIIFANIDDLSIKLSLKSKERINEHIRISDNNNCLIVRDSTGKISIYETNAGNLLSRFQTNRGWITDLALSKEYSIGVSAGPEHDLTSWAIPEQCKVDQKQN